MKTKMTRGSGRAYRLLPALGVPLLLALPWGSAETPTAAQAVAIRAAVPAVPDGRLVLRPASKLWLEGDSNLHEWSCTAGTVNAELAVDAAEPSRVERVGVSVPVAQIGCGNGKMDENLRKALKADRFASIDFRMTRVKSFERIDEGAFIVVAEGQLSVAGASRPIELQVTGSDTGDGGLRIQGRQGLLMTDFGVQPPTALLGMLKTKNEFVVLFDLVADYEALLAYLPAAAIDW